MTRRSPTLAAVLGIVLAFLYLPIVTLMVLSFNASPLATVWGGFSTQWYAELLDDAQLLEALRNTLLVAAAATLVATVLGTLLAVGIERHTRGAVMESVTFVPLIIPDIVFGIALLALFSTAGLALGLSTVVLAHVTFDIAFVAAIVRTRLRGLDPAIEEASLDLGATPAQTFLRVTLPVILPGVVAGGLVAFTLSVDEFVIAFFTAGLDVTFPIRVYSMIRFGVTPEVNAIATILVVLSVTLILLAARILGGRATTIK